MPVELSADSKFAKSPVTSPPTDSVAKCSLYWERLRVFVMSFLSLSVTSRSFHSTTALLVRVPKADEREEML